MFRRVAIAVVAALFIVPLTLPLFAYHLHKIADEEVHRFLNHAGFSYVSTARQIKKERGLIFKNTKLDQDNFSTVSTTEVAYTWRDMRSNRTFETITLKDIKLIGDIDKHGKILISGWNLIKTPILNTKELRIEDGVLDLSWPNVGAFTLKADLVIRRVEDRITISGTVNSPQKPIQFNGKTTGLINTNGTWTIDINIEDGKIDHGLIQANRISGVIELTGQGLKQPDSLMQLTSGNTTIHNLHWQNVSASIEGWPSDYRIYLSGKTIRPKPLEFSATLKPWDLTVTTYASNLNDLALYFSKQDMLESVTQDGSHFQLKNGMEIKQGLFEYKYDLLQNNKKFGAFEFESTRP